MKRAWTGWPPYGFEYVEDTALHDRAWGDLIEKYAKEGWRLAFAFHDEGEADVLQARLIFERPREGPEDELGYPITPEPGGTFENITTPIVARVPTAPSPRQRTVVGSKAPTTRTPAPTPAACGSEHVDSADDRQEEEDE